MAEISKTGGTQPDLYIYEWMNIYNIYVFISPDIFSVPKICSKLPLKNLFPRKGIKPSELSSFIIYIHQKSVVHWVVSTVILIGSKQINKANIYLKFKLDYTITTFHSIEINLNKSYSLSSLPISKRRLEEYVHTQKN